MRRQNISAIVVAMFATVGVAFGASQSATLIQISGSTDILAGMVTQGLRAASSNPPLNMGTGTLTAGSAVTPSVIQGSNTTLNVGGFEVTTDAAVASNTHIGSHAYSQASTNTTGGCLTVASGLGSCKFQVSSAAAGAKFLLYLNGGAPVTLSDGTDFTHSATDSVEATNLATAINASAALNTQVSATASTNNIYITPLTGCWDCYLDVSGAGVFKINGARGATYLAGSMVNGSPMWGFNLGGSVEQYDFMPPVSVLQGMSAYSRAASFQTGGNQVVAAGLGCYSFTIVTASALSGATFTIYINGSNVYSTFTDGSSFTHSNTNSVEATNLSNAIGSNLGVTAVCPASPGNVVYIYPSYATYGAIANTMTYSIFLASSGGANVTVANGTDGNTLLPQGAQVGVSSPTTVTAKGLTFIDGNNVILGTSTGTKIGTATNQKLGFYNSTPVVQTTGSTDVLAGLVTLGLRASSSNPPLNLGTGTLTAGTSNLGAVAQTGMTTTYNNIVTAGWGVPAIMAQANATAQSAANSSVATYTNTAADGNYEVCMTCNVTAATSISAPLQVSYTDVNNTAQTMTLPVQKATGTGGTYLASGLIIAIGDYSTPVTSIRVKASTSITLKTGSGTYTGVTYSVSGVIKRTS